MTKTTRATTISLLSGIVLSLVVGLVYAIAQNTLVLLGVLGVYLSIVISFLLSQSERLRAIEEQNEIAGGIARNPLARRFYEDTGAHFAEADRIEDSVYKGLLTGAIDDFRMKLACLSSGVCEFQAESWRKPWQELLSQDDVAFYYSVALVKSPSYWQNQPGKASISHNKMVASTIRTKRIFIIWDAVWEDQGIRDWIAEQEATGIDVAVVRRSEIPAEEDLLHDFGIYGERAVGYQFLDSDCRTLKFEFHFGREMHQKTLDRFKTLELYATAESAAEYLAMSAQPV